MMIVSGPRLRRTPELRTLEKAWRPLSGSTQPRSGGETLATLVAPRLQDGSSRAGLHAVSKAVLALAASDFWLIGTFHEEIQIWGLTDEGYGLEFLFVKA